jgi:hypothetical protein
MTDNRVFDFRYTMKEIVDKKNGLNPKDSKGVVRSSIEDAQMS